MYLKMTAPGSHCTSKPPLRGPRCSVSAKALAHDAGVSEVVGEMLMIGLVIILIGVFAAALGNFLPTARDPSVTILLTNDTHNISLWHKGGDWVKTEDLTVVISNDTLSRKYCANSTQRKECSLDFDMVSDNSHTAVFDLGSRINVTAGPLAGDETISLVTPGSRIFIGRLAV
jgi:archaeal type IV pilus assembly protein PilA